MGARSELGGRHCRVHAASAAALLATGAEAPPGRPPPIANTSMGQAQFQVAGQSVSTLHAPVGCATQVLHVIDEHVLVGFKLALGGATGGRTLAQGMLVAMA